MITGGANGIGAATARRFVQDGAKVVVADIDGAQGEDLWRRTLGDAGVFAPCDVTQSADIEAAIAAAEQRFGGLDVMVNNAAIQNVKPIMETTEAEWDTVMSVNLKSVFLGIRAAVPALRRRGGGVIINTSSTFAIVGSPGYAAYHASKGGISALTRAAAISLISGEHSGRRDLPGYDRHTGTANRGRANGAGPGGCHAILSRTAAPRPVRHRPRKSRMSWPFWPATKRRLSSARRSSPMAPTPLFSGCSAAAYCGRPADTGIDRP